MVTFRSRNLWWLSFTKRRARLVRHWSLFLQGAEVRNVHLSLFYINFHYRNKTFKIIFTILEIGDLSLNFVMVNANNGEYPSSESVLSPDGSYVPRILFLNSNGELLKDVTNEQVWSKRYFKKCRAKVWSFRVKSWLYSVQCFLFITF